MYSNQPPPCVQKMYARRGMNDTKTIKVHVDGNKFYLGKNGGYIPNSLGGRSISLGRQ